jgi:hypothetical protein
VMVVIINMLRLNVCVTVVWALSRKSFSA